MKLLPDTLKAHQCRHRERCSKPSCEKGDARRQQEQLELPLDVPQEHYRESISRMNREANARDFPTHFADVCRWCGGIHMTKAERAQCMLDNSD